MITLDAEIFLDAAYLVASGQSDDAFHTQTMELAAAIQAQCGRIVTSRAILLEN